MTKTNTEAETTAEKIKTSITKDVRFSKEQILRSAKYNKRRDLLNVLLKDNETYTISAVDKLIDDYMKGGKR